MERNCNNCGGSEFKEVLSQEYQGWKGSSRRDPTEKKVFMCMNCEKEGRKFIDGVGGEVTYTGVLRE